MEIFWIALLFDVAFAGLYYGMAKAISKRRVSGEAQWALYGFTVWWAALAVSSGLTVAGKLVQHFIGWSIPAYMGYVAVAIVIIMYALAGLQYYLLYLVTGKWGAWKPVVGYYLLMIGYTMYFIFAGDPSSIGMDHSTGSIDVEYANPIEDTPQAMIFSLALLLPVTIGALAYASFFFKVEDRSQKFRVAMVSIGFIVWFGVALAGSVGGTDSTSLWWTLLSRVVALVAIWMNYQAFRPNKWMQEKFNIQPI